jgi:serine/threonine protein kinase
MADMTPKAVREMRMMLLAGEDISVKLEGRDIIRGRVTGFVMQNEGTLVSELVSASKDTKRRWIDELQTLVRRVHEKGVIHGDIKPDNVLVRRSDGKLVLCDWAAAQLEEDAVKPHEGTTAYQSPWRCRNYNLPLCREDDLYALGVSILQIWLGREPFDPEKHKYLDDDIADGLQPELNEVDDETLRGLIETYLKETPASRAFNDND